MSEAGPISTVPVTTAPAEQDRDLRLQISAVAPDGFTYAIPQWNVDGVTRRSVVRVDCRS